MRSKSTLNYPARQAFVFNTLAAAHTIVTFPFFSGWVYLAVLLGGRYAIDGAGALLVCLCNAALFISPLLVPLKLTALCPTLNTYIRATRGNR